MDIIPNCCRDQYDGYLLMKFFSKEEHRDAFLKGKLYCNTSDFFARCEHEGQGDWNEGNNLIVNPNEHNLQSLNLEIVDNVPMMVLRDYTNDPENYKPSTVFTYSTADNRNRKLLCFYTLYLNIAQNRIATVSPKMKAEFGDFGVLILKRQPFFDRVCSTINVDSSLHGVYMGFVSYESLQPGVNDWHPFKKNAERFSHQNEFRLTFLNSDAEPYTLDLKQSLSDIAVPIQIDDIEKIHFENGNLCYPIYKSV